MLELPRRPAKRIALLVLPPAYVFAGVNHFVNPEFYLAMMPPYLPAHGALVFWSGVFEVLGGVAVLAPGLRRQAGWGLVLLLIAVYPANVHMALHPEQFADVSRSALFARLPVQFLLIAWAYWATRPDAPAAAGATESHV